MTGSPRVKVARAAWRPPRRRGLGPKPNAGNGLCLMCGLDLKGRLAYRYGNGVVGVSCEDNPPRDTEPQIVERPWDFRPDEVTPHGA